MIFLVVPQAKQLADRQGVNAGQGNLACHSPWGHKESNRTEQMN